MKNVGDDIHDFHEYRRYGIRDFHEYHPAGICENHEYHHPFFIKLKNNL